MSQPLHRIGTVAKLVGLSTHAIRVWERRYGAATPQRAPGGARLYTDEDVRRFKLIHGLLHHGYAARAIATLSLAELSKLAQPTLDAIPRETEADDEPRAETVIARLLDSLTVLDVEAAERVLVQAGNDFSPRDLLTRVFAPALSEIGERWVSGALCTAAEHAASSMFRTRLGALLSAQPVGTAPPVVCTTLAGDQHELGALLVAVLIAMRGRRAVFLGANLPADQIAEAARLSQASGVALSIVGLPVRDARRELTRVIKLLPETVALGIGGRATFGLDTLPKRVNILTNLSDLDSWLETQPAS